MSKLKVLGDIGAERDRQDAKWGADRNLPDFPQTYRRGSAFARVREEEAKRHCSASFLANDPNWFVILQEEVAEALATTDTASLRAELIQVAAVAVAWVEAIDRRNGGI
jgi:hypothetical protein